MGNIFDKIKRAFRGTAERTTDSAEKVADPDVYTGSNNANENIENKKGGNEPMTQKILQDANLLRSRGIITRAIQLTQFNHYLFKIYV